MTLDRIIMPDIEKLIKELSKINSTRRKKVELPNHLNSIELPENDSSESLTILNLNQELKLKIRIFFSNFHI